MARSASITGHGGTPRAARPAAASRPGPDDRRAPSRRRRRGARRRVRRRRCSAAQPLHPGARAHDGGDPVADDRGLLVALGLGQRGELALERLDEGRDVAGPGRRRRGRRARRTRSGSTPPSHGAPQRPMPASTHARAHRRGAARAGRCTGAAAPRRGWRRAPPRPAAANAAGRGRTRRRRGRRAPPTAAGTASTVSLSHTDALRELRPPVVARLVRGDQPQLAHLRLERVRARDRVDPLGQADHLAHPAARLAGDEVLPHPGAQVAARADVERDGPARRGRCRRPAPAGSPSARCRLRRWASETCAVNARSSGSDCTPRLPSRSISPCSTSTVARASSSARWLGVVAARKNWASVDSLQLGTSSRVSTRRASTAVSTTAKPGPRQRERGARRLEEPDVERRVVRDEHAAARELEEGRQRRRRSAARRTPSRR